MLSMVYKYQQEMVQFQPEVSRWQPEVIGNKPDVIKGEKMWNNAMDNIKHRPEVGGINRK